MLDVTAVFTSHHKLKNFVIMLPHLSTCMQCTTSKIGFIVKLILQAFHTEIVWIGSTFVFYHQFHNQICRQLLQILRISTKKTWRAVYLYLMMLIFGKAYHYYYIKCFGIRVYLYENDHKSAKTDIKIFKSTMYIALSRNCFLYSFYTCPVERLPDFLHKTCVLLICNM